MKDMLVGMPIASLPKTFRDAISVARSLAFRYIWIDSLCIVQDSVEDWRQEAAYMQEIYTYSSCTIAATAAADGEGGCFSERDPSSLRLSKIALRWADKADERNYLLIDDQYVDKQLTTAPLNRRGWVLQERILSPRTLHFGQSQMFWQCRETMACEAFPRDLPWFLTESDEWSTEWSTHSKTSFPSDIDVTDIGETLAERRKRLYWRWWKLVSMYMRLALTVPEDKLVAISGLAKGFGEALGNDDYLAGLWRGSLPNDLLWSVWNDKQSNGLDSSRPSNYRAPSWSWASVEADVNAGPWNPGTDDTVLIECLEAWTRSLTDEPTGQVFDGLIRLRGRLMQAYCDERCRELRILSRWFNAHVQFDCPTMTTITDTYYYLPVKMYTSDLFDVHQEGVQGLILRQRPWEGENKEPKYERIGWWGVDTTPSVDMQWIAESLRGVRQIRTICENAPHETFAIM
jgi:hypothetical protein